MVEHYDIAIIGAGPGGYSTALRAAQLGLSVALVEKDQKLGGTCLNRGCIPSKALIEATRTIADVRDGARMGINASIESIDFERLNRYKQDSVVSMTEGLSSLLKARGVTVITGSAEMTGPRQIAVSPSNQDHAPGPEDRRHRTGERTDGDSDRVARHAQACVRIIEADDIVLATGSRPRPLPDIPFEGTVIDSTTALDLPRFPRKATIIGSGTIAVEFASMWRQAGVEVTLLIRGDRVLSAWHRRTSQALTRSLKRQGVNVITHSHALRIDGSDRSQPSTALRYITEGDDGEHTLTTDIVLVAIGRDPNTDEPWFETNSLNLDEHGLVVTNEYGRTNLPHVWALGDITKGPGLAHRAFAQGLAIAETIAGLHPQPVDDNTVAKVVFTTPQAASVGLTLDQANDDDAVISAEETIYPMLGNPRIMMSGQPASLALVTGRYTELPDVTVLLGAHMLAPDAGDLIAEAEELIGNRVPLDRASSLIHPHPTFAEAMGEALLKADGRPLNTR